MYWAVNKAVEYLQGALKAGVAYDELQIKDFLEQAKFAHRKITTEGGDIGSLVHDAIEQYIKSGKVSGLVNAKAKKSFARFLEWEKENEVKFLECEKKVYSRKYEYAGTMDFYCEIKGKRFVGDVKTGSGIWDEMWFQTSAYQQAYQEEVNAKVDGHLIVRIDKQGGIEVAENYDYEKNVKAFNGALLLYKRVMEIRDQKEKEKRGEGK
jgi:CRISPR/Cas system-associated exonuclease Cas4 (RecB family)